MTEPHEYLIFERLAANLAAIDPSRGYYATVEDVAVRLDPDEAVSETEDVYPLVVLETMPGEKWEWEPAQQAICTFAAKISWLDKVAPSDTTPPETLPKGARLLRYWRACTDIAKALADDVTLGGLAIDVRIVNRHWPRERYDGAVTVAEVEIQIRTRRDFLTPGAY